MDTKPPSTDRLNLSWRSTRSQTELKYFHQCILKHPQTISRKRLLELAKVHPDAETTIYRDTL